MSRYTENDKKEAYRLIEDENTHPGDLEILKDYRDFILYKSNMPDGSPSVDHSFRQMQQAYGAWNIRGMMKAAKRLVDRAGEEDFMHTVYSENEIRQDPQKKDVRIFFFPSSDKGASQKPFVISIAGGAYNSVCSLAESFPTAATMNEAGYNVFVLNYRVNPSDPAKVTESLMPKPMEDVAASLRYIYEHMKVFGQENKAYIVNGFSAGAGITLLWGTQEFGYPYYDLPKPKALFPVYAPAESDKVEQSRQNELLTVMFGPDYDMNTVARYAVPKVMTKEFPPCYLVHAIDDPTVPVSNTYAVRDRMMELSIPVFAEIVPSGGHGFGDGTGSAAEGWPVRALAYSEKL